MCGSVFFFLFLKHSLLLPLKHPHIICTQRPAKANCPGGWGVGEMPHLYLLINSLWGGLKMKGGQKVRQQARAQKTALLSHVLLRSRFSMICIWPPKYFMSVVLGKAGLELSCMNQQQLPMVASVLLV